MREGKSGKSGQCLEDEVKPPAHTHQKQAQSGALVFLTNRSPDTVQTLKRTGLGAKAVDSGDKRTPIINILISDARSPAA